MRVVLLLLRPVPRCFWGLHYGGVLGLFCRLLRDLGGEKCVIFLIHVKIIAYADQAGEGKVQMNKGRGGSGIGVGGVAEVGGAAVVGGW